MEGPSLTQWLIGGGLFTILSAIGSAFTWWVKVRADAAAAKAKEDAQVAADALSLEKEETERLKAQLAAQGIDGGQEIEARKIVDTTMLKLADTLNARVNTVETENVTIRGLLRECEKQHGDVRVQNAQLAEQHKHCEGAVAELRAENREMRVWLTKTEAKVDSVMVNPPAPAAATTGQGQHPTNVYVQVGPEAGAAPLEGKPASGDAG